MKHYIYPDLVDALKSGTNNESFAILIEGAARGVVDMEQLDMLHDKVAKLVGETVEMIVVDHSYTDAGNAAKSLSKQIAVMSGPGRKCIVVVSNKNLEAIELDQERLAKVLFKDIINSELQRAELEMNVMRTPDDHSLPGNSIFNSKWTLPLGSASPDLRTAWEAGELAGAEGVDKAMRVVDAALERDPPRICYIAITRDLKPLSDNTLRVHIIGRAVASGQVEHLTGKDPPADNYTDHLLP